MNLHLCIGLLAAFIALAFFRDWLAANDDFLQIFASICIGVCVGMISFNGERIYRLATHYQDPAEVEKAQLIMNVIRSEDQRLDIQINSTINGHHVPMQLNGNGYVCRKVR